MSVLAYLGSMYATLMPVCAEILLQGISTIVLIPCSSISAHTGMSVAYIDPKYASTDIAAEEGGTFVLLLCGMCMWRGPLSIYTWGHPPHHWGGLMYYTTVPPVFQYYMHDGTPCI